MAGLRVVLLGPPGAGKGTQAKLLGERFDACQISTGDILRKSVAEKTPLGREAAGYISRGALVPDDVIVKLVAERLLQQDCRNGFVLDGFPRTIGQAESLDAMLDKEGVGLDAVLSIQVPRDVIVERLAGRRNCSECGALYHLTFNPPKNPAACDRCQSGLHQREDDREETVMNRLDVYDTQTAPLADYYRGRGQLREIGGVGKVDDIHGRIVRALEEPVN